MFQMNVSFIFYVSDVDFTLFNATQPTTPTDQPEVVGLGWLHFCLGWAGLKTINIGLGCLNIFNAINPIHEHP